MKRIAWVAALVLGTLTALVVLWQFREAFVIFLLSLAGAAAVRPVIDALTRRGVKHGFALLITYFTFTGLVVILLAVLSGPVVHDLEQLTNHLSVGYENYLAAWSKSDDMVQSAIARQLPPTKALFESLGGEEGRQALQGLLGTASSLAGFFGQTVVIIILSIYWTSDRVHFERLWMSLIPVEARTLARSIWRDIETGVGSYILSEIVQSYLVVLLLWLGFSLIGIPQPALLALFSALFWFVPWLGAILALVPVILSGLSVSPLVALGGGLMTVAVLAVMELFVQPRFFSRQRFNSIFLLLVVIIFTRAFGILGLILAPALAAALEIGFQNITARRENQIQTEKVSEEIRKLQANLLDLQVRLQSLGPEEAPELVNLTERLEALMEKTILYLADAGEVPRSLILFWKQQAKT